MTNLNWTPNANTVAYYTLDGDINDHSGNGYDMSSRLGTITYGTLSGGKSYGIFGGNTIVSTTNKTTVSTGTVNAWVNYQGNGLVFMDNEDADNSNNYVSIFVFAGDYWTIYSPSTFEQTTTAPGSGWNLLTATQDGNKLIFYINGTKIQEWNSSIFLHSKNGNQWCIGGQARGTQYYDKLNGYISDIIIENKVRTEEEVRAYYNQTCTDYGLQPIQTTKYIDRYYLNGELYGIKFAEPGWQPGANTIAYYQFDNNLNDSSGNGHNMTLYTGSVTYGTASGGGKYAYFNNSTWTNYWTYTIPDLSGTHTVSIWFNPQATYSSSTHAIIEIATSNAFYRIYNSIKTGVTFSPDATYSVSTNNWYNIIFVRSGTTGYWYINGTLITQGTVIHTGTNVTERFRLNQVHDTNSSSYANNGYYSEVIWEDKARTQQEVLDYYNQTKSLYGIS